MGGGTGSIATVQGFPADPKPLYRNRDYVLLWTGQAVSVLGSRISTMAFPLLVLAVTHSPAKAGVTGFLSTLPYLLFYLPAGGLMDRWNRKRTIWSPDGTPIAIAVNGTRDGEPGGTALVPADGSGGMTFVSGSRAYYPDYVSNPTWSPDGQWIAYTHGYPGKIVIVHPDGSGARTLKDQAHGHSRSTRGTTASRSWRGERRPRHRVPESTRAVTCG